MSDTSRNDVQSEHNVRCFALTTESVQLLLDAGADINARNAVGMNPLERARVFGREDLLRLLPGVDADAEAWNAWTALSERFQSYNACKPIDFSVSVDNPDNGSLHGLQMIAIYRALPRWAIALGEGDFAWDVPNRGSQRRNGYFAQNWE